jgi:plasmid stabilization system protein ParE
MPEVRFSQRALTGLDRIFDFFGAGDPDVARRAGAAIIDATGALQRHPMIGRSLRGNVRELIISHGRSGYVALYRYLPRSDRVDVLSIRHPREAGYA